MTYSRDKDEVTVKFSLDEYCILLALLGWVLVTAEDPKIFMDCAKFIKEMNRTNPDFKMYAKVFGGEGEAKDGKTKPTDGQN